MKKIILFLLSSIFIYSCDYNPPILAGSTSAGFADGVGENAKFGRIYSATIDKDGSLYLADRSNNRIRKVDANGNMSTFAGTGERSSKDGNRSIATFNEPDTIIFDDIGNMYVGETTKIRKIDINGNVSTIAGNDNIFTDEYKEKNKLTENPLEMYFEYPIPLKVDNGELYFGCSNIVYYAKISINNKVVEITDNLQDMFPYSGFIGFDKYKMNLYLAIKTENIFSNELEIIQLNLLSKEYKKVDLIKGITTFTFDSKGNKYSLYDSVIYKNNKEIYSFKFRRKSNGNWGMSNELLVLDEPRNILYIIESSYYYRIYKLNLN